MTKEEFIEKQTITNAEWSAQTLLQAHTAAEINQMRHQLKKLHKTLYKSWARDQTLDELLDVMEILKELK